MDNPAFPRSESIELQVTAHEQSQAIGRGSSPGIRSAPESRTRTVPVGQVMGQPQASYGQGLSSKPGFGVDRRFQVTWEDVTCKMKFGFLGFNEHTKIALDRSSGCFASGELVGLLGPSGSGKTVLLEALMGLRISGMTGEVSISGRRRVKMAFVPQDDHMLSQFTVKETFIYASQLKNIEGDVSHEDIAEQVIKDLNLERCKDNKVLKCSGGQQKRVTIGQELVSKPQILILDEPTSGLDSTLCFQAIKLLQDIVRISTDRNEPLVIVSVIHQPPARVFNLFDRVHVLSINGQSIYDGAPSDMLPMLSMAGLNCPERYNPADYIVEIAACEYGEQACNTLAQMHSTKMSGGKIRSSARPREVKSWKNDLLTAGRVGGLPFFQHSMVLFSRAWVMTIRDPVLTWLRLFSHLVVPLYMGLLYGTEVGNMHGCPRLQKSILSMDHPELMHMPIEKDEIEHEAQWLGYAYAVVTFSMMVIAFMSVLITILSFPLEFQVIIREYYNGWYSASSYFISRNLVELPWSALYSAMFILIVLPCVGMWWELWRVAGVAGISILVGMVGQSYGFLFGALCVENLYATVFLAPLAVVPMLLLSGFLVRIHKLGSVFMKYLTELSFIRFGYEASVTLLYGFDHCVCNFPDPDPSKAGDWVTCLDLNDEEPMEDICRPNATLVDTFDNITGGGVYAYTSCAGYKPIPYDEFRLEDDDLYRSIIKLVVQIVILRLLTMLATIYQLRKRK